MEEGSLKQIKFEDNVAPGSAVANNPSIQTLLMNKIKGRIPKIAVIVVIVLVVLGLAIGIPLFGFYGNAKAFAKVAQKMVQIGSEKDLEKIKTGLSETKTSLAKLKGSYNLISWMKYIPYLGGFISDTGHAIAAGQYGLEMSETLLVTIEPYADIIGLKGGGQALSGEQTTQERIDFVVKTLPNIIPKMGEIGDKMAKVKTEVDYIDPTRYPKTFRGIAVQDKLVQLKEMVNQASDFVINGKPILEQAPYLLGIDSPRTYLVLFQNDKELRPTGGFLTAYSIMSVSKAKFDPVLSNDIYNLDAKYKPTIAAPDPIVKYIKGPYALSPNLRLRDMNWSPDFSDSMKLFSDEAQKAGIKDIDGIIAVDTQLVVYLLDVLGEIGVTGFGNFSTKTLPVCNCPQVIYELESFADVEGPIVWDPAGTGKIIYQPPNADNRKKIIGPLMNAIMANVLGQPKDKLPALFEAGIKSLMEKHVLLYMFDADAQKAVVDFGIAGKIRDYSGDYLHINDSNLGGRKSNLYVTQEVAQSIEVGRDGTVRKTITITYKNPEKQDGWLNSVLPNWVRIYVPKGSKLVSFDGVTEKDNPQEEFGKTVFAGYFELRPQGVVKVEIAYELPFKVKGDYSLLIQKQPGTANSLYTIELGKKQEEFLLNQDREIKLSL